MYDGCVCLGSFNRQRLRFIMFLQSCELFCIYVFVFLPWDDHQGIKSGQGRGVSVWLAVCLGGHFQDVRK